MAQVLSLPTWSRFQGSKLKKLLVGAFALIMLGVSGFAILKAMDILAAESGWSIAADGTGLINVLKATNDNTGVERTAYCLDPYTDFDAEYADYVDAETGEVANIDEVRALLERAYPVLTARQMGLVYLNDGTLTDLEAYEATQIAVWEVVTGGEYEVSEVLVGRQFELAEQVVASDVVMNEGQWLTVDASSAVRVNSNSTRDSFGPIKIEVNTGSANLDAAIRQENLTLVADAGRSWVMSTSNGVSGSAATSLRVGTSYYINYPKTAAGTMNFSLTNVLADSRVLDNFGQIVSTLGVRENQILGVVEDEPKTAAASLGIDGNLNLKINKTWTCSGTECSKYYGEEITFDVYETVAGGGYALVGSVTTEFESGMTPNRATEIANNIVLKSYTEYTVVERVLVAANVGNDDIVPSAAMGAGYGTAGKYKIENGVLATAGAGEAYYAGVRFVSGVKGGTEVVNFTNRLASLQITLKNSTYVEYEFPDSYIPGETNYYIYASTDGGASWEQTEGPIRMYDFDTGVSEDYVFEMEYGTRYRLVQDTESYDRYEYDGCYTYNPYVYTSLSGVNYSNLVNVRAKTFWDYADGSAVSWDTSFPRSSISSDYAGIEWEAGFGDSNSSLTISNSFYYSVYYDSSCDPPDMYSWGRRAALQQTTSGNNPNGAWAASYKLDWEVSGDYSNSGSQGGELGRRMSLNSSTIVATASEPYDFFNEGGEAVDYSFPSVTYTVTEDPASFCGGVSQTTDVTTTLIGGISRTTTTTATSEIAISLPGSSGYSSVSYQYAAADCDTGTITGSWGTGRPSGGYAARAVVNVYNGTQYSDITVLVTNSYRETTSVRYNTVPSPGDDGQDVERGVALVVKYGHDGTRKVADYLDGTEFEIYNAAGEYVMDWTLEGGDRGLYGSVGGTSAYYVSPLLPLGEYYLMETAAVEGYIADTESKYYFTVAELDNATTMSIAAEVKNTPEYSLSVYKFKRKVLAEAISDSYIELYRLTETTEEPAYGNENLRGYEKVREFESLEDGMVIRGLEYGWYRLVEVTPPMGFVGPEPEVAVGYSVYVGPRSASENNYSGARVYIANDWVGLEVNPPDDPEVPEVPEVPKTGVAGEDTEVNGGMVAATFLGMGSALVVAIGVFVGKRLTDEIERDGNIKLRR